MENKSLRHSVLNKIIVPENVMSRVKWEEIL